MRIESPYRSLLAYIDTIHEHHLAQTLALCPTGSLYPPFAQIQAHNGQPPLSSSPQRCRFVVLFLAPTPPSGLSINHPVQQRIASSGQSACDHGTEQCTRTTVSQKGAMNGPLLPGLPTPSDQASTICGLAQLPTSTQQAAPGAENNVIGPG
ncbi:MAG TPA: hypothetical protein VGF67_20415 [Ktedonobacteraceae bacterium]